MQCVRSAKRRLRACLFALASALVVVPLVHAASSLAVQRGWRPMITLAGVQDSGRAVLLLREVARLWAIVLQHTELEPATRELLQRATSSLHDFNLRRMYELLPEQDGRFHALSLSGAFSGQRYLIGRQKSARDAIGPSGQRRAMGDASFVLRAAPIRGPEDDTNYLLQGRAGIVVGPVDWPMVVDAARELLRLLGSAEPDASPLVASRQNVLRHNPKLGPEDIDPVATLWEAYPQLGQLSRTLGGIDDVIDAARTATPGVTRLRAVLHLDPKLMQARYPELSDYLDDLDELFEADLRWLDSHDRTIAVLHLDSRSLTVRLELYVKDGMWVPSRAGLPIADMPLAAGPGAFRSRVLVSANFRALGLVMQLRGVQLNLALERTERRMELRGRMQQIPTMAVSGAALGFIPPGLIDAIIPGDIQGLAQKFLRTACEGNSGRGVQFDAQFDRPPGGQATVNGEIAFEAIDNFLVKLGVSHFSEYVMPDQAARADLSRLLLDLQRAFSADLQRYASAR